MIGRLIRWLIVVPILGLLVYVTHPFLLRAIGRYLITEDPLEKAEAIVVLSGDGGVSRTLEAIRLYQDGYAPKIILTHQIQPKGYEALARLKITVPEERDIQWMILKAMRVPSRAVMQVRQRAHSTESEAVYLTRFLGENRIRSLILVTSKSHSTRARKVLVHVSGGRITIVSRPTRYDDFDPTTWWRSRIDAKDVLLEYEKLLNHWAQAAAFNLSGWLGRQDRSRTPAEAAS